jgi:uroporphyrin-III C-methyltransferase
VVEELTEKQQTMQMPPEQTSKSRGGLWIGIIILLIIALIAGASFYLYQQLRSQGDDISKEDQRTQETAKQVSGFQAQLATLQSQLTDATSTISNADERIEEKMAERAKMQEEKLETTRKELTGAILQIQRQLGKTRGDWLIADAEYLLSVAGQRLHLMGDVDTTREALEAADQRLRESGDVATFKVREEIAKELSSLNAIPAIDLVGMYAKLQSLSSRVNQLTLFLPYDGKPLPKSSEHDKHNTPSLTSSDLVNSALKQLDGYVTVRHTAQPIKAILTAEEAQFIRQQLSLKLEMIKLALVQKNQNLYQASLEDALAWLDKNFNKNAYTQQFATDLTQLNGFKLNAQMPDISGSLKMLRDITKLRIESDKAMPPIDLESKLELPKAAEPKLTAVEIPSANPVPASVETVKPAVITPVTPTVNQTSEVKKAIPAEAVSSEMPKSVNAPVPVTDAKPASKPAPVVEEKKSLGINKTTTPTAVVEPKKVAEPAIPVENAAPKSSEKTPQPALIKPVVVH